MTFTIDGHAVMGLGALVMLGAGILFGVLWLRGAISLIRKKEGLTDGVDHALGWGMLVLWLLAVGALIAALGKEIS